ncbi:MAG: hypothetical protein HFACDABA_02230 [Anaerolineales bacterium]|nr:hypothetical protein [Anaerolineales bacterium]
MLLPSSLLRLPIPRDLIEGGIAYAVRSLPHTFDRKDGSPYDRLRRIVAGVAVELAFRRHLTQMEIPFEVKGATPFSDPDRYDVTLGGHRCDVKSFLISHREQIQALHSTPHLLLDAPALVPLDQHAAEGQRDDDLYLFAFVTSLLAIAQRDLQKALAAGQPIHLTNVLPKNWRAPHNWTPLGALALKSDCDAPITVELHGQTEEREFVSETLLLPPRTRVEANTKFFALAALHAQTPPDGRIAVHSPARRDTCVIHPLEWGNLWVYGMDIYFTGWIPRDEFRRRAELIREGARVFQFEQTRVKNLAVPIRELHPLDELFEKVKEWERRKN